MSDRLIQWVVDRMPEWLVIGLYWRERRKRLSPRARGFWAGPTTPTATLHTSARIVFEDYPLSYPIDEQRIARRLAEYVA